MNNIYWMSELMPKCEFSQWSNLWDERRLKRNQPSLEEAKAFVNAILYSRNSQNQKGDKK